LTRHSQQYTSDTIPGNRGSLRALVAYNLSLNDEPTARGSVEAQRRIFAELGMTVDEVTTEADLLARLVRGTDTPLVYLYAHIVNEGPALQPDRSAARTTPAGVYGTRIILTSGNALTLRELERSAPLEHGPLLHGNPLVVLNACGSAAQSPLASAGLVPYLQAQGARACIGTECDIPAVFGAAFGSALLMALVRDRLTVGAALRAARRAFLEREHNPLGLLYALYGSADLAMAVPG
jgi:hypothetical protein